jgi:hypothetical protein
MQSIVWCPTCFEMDPSAGRSTGGAALLLTNQAVASNVPFAKKYPASRRCILSCQRGILLQLAFTRAPQTNRGEMPDWQTPNSFYLT